MSTRRDVALGLVIAGAGSALAVNMAQAQAKVSEAEALEALDPWADALFTGDPAVVGRVLAEEFQILRSNGRGHDKASYLEALPRQATRSKFSDIAATGNGATLVIRYKIETEQTIDGHPVNGVSPRLSVFRKEAGRGWLIVAHANFAPIAA
jgi:ketosteroid isomerase-like protein